MDRGNWLSPLIERIGSGLGTDLVGLIQVKDAGEVGAKMDKFREEGLRCG